MATQGLNLLVTLVREGRTQVTKRKMDKIHPSARTNTTLEPPTELLIDNYNALEVIQEAFDFVLRRTMTIEAALSKFSETQKSILSALARNTGDIRRDLSEWYTFLALYHDETIFLETGFLLRMYQYTECQLLGQNRRPKSKNVSNPLGFYQTSHSLIGIECMLKKLKNRGAKLSFENKVRELSDKLRVLKDALIASYLEVIDYLKKKGYSIVPQQRLHLMAQTQFVNRMNVSYNHLKPITL